MVAVPVVILPSVVRLLRGAAFTRPEVQGGQRRDQERHGSGLHVEPFHTLYLDTFGVALFAAAAPSLIKRPDFPYGLEEEDVIKIIDGTYNDRPKMLSDFGDTFFFSTQLSHFLIGFYN